MKYLTDFRKTVETGMDPRPEYPSVTPFSSPTWRPLEASSKLSFLYL